MRTAHKIIKYFAISLACLLSLSIFVGLFGAAFGLTSILGFVGTTAPESTVDCANYEKCISLSLGNTELEIKKGGDKIWVESEDKDRYEITRAEKKLAIKETKAGGWFDDGPAKKLVVTVPNDMEFDVIGIFSRAGKVSVDGVATDKMVLSLGAGESVLQKIKVNEKAEVETGAGRFAVLESEINNAEVKFGVGEALIQAVLTGDNKIDAGIGSVKLDLLLPESEYEIKADKGIGEILFNGKKIASGETIGLGKNKLDVDGGIGEIKITTKNN